MKIGDRVVCVDNSGFTKDNPLIKGREYLIYRIIECKLCKSITFDVGVTLPTDSLINCYSCFVDNSLKRGDTWNFRPSRFRKVEEQVNYVKLEVEIEEPCLN